MQASLTFQRSFRRGFEMPWGFKVTRPFRKSTLSAATTRGVLVGRMKDMTRRMQKDMQATVATWATQPQIVAQFRFSGGVARIRVYTTDKRWNWLNKGTDIRWALMSNDWISKTTPGFLGSGSGAGFVVARGAGAMKRMGFKNPLPGIEARGWTPIIVEIYQGELDIIVREAVIRGVVGR